MLAAARRAPSSVEKRLFFRQMLRRVRIPALLARKSAGRARVNRRSALQRGGDGLGAVR
jgi:hypothetical protein